MVTVLWDVIHVTHVDSLPSEQLSLLTANFCQKHCALQRGHGYNDSERLFFSISTTHGLTVINVPEKIG
jgi:hypothetical protein